MTHFEACAEPTSTPTSKPTPGRYYQIKPGDTLLAVAGRAYGVGPGKQRLQFARLINNASYNRRFWRIVEKERHLFPPQGRRVSFNPRFTCDLDKQITAKGAVPKGRCYALIWIPPRDGKPVARQSMVRRRPTQVRGRRPQARARPRRTVRRPVARKRRPSRARVRRPAARMRVRRQPRRAVRRGAPRRRVRRPAASRRRRRVRLRK